MASGTLVSCDKAKSLTKKSVDCNDPIATDLVKSMVQKNILSATKEYLQDAQSATDSSIIRATVNQLKIAISDVRTSKKDPESTKNFCVGTLKVSMNSDLVSTADFVRKYYGQQPVKESAFQQDLELDANTISYNLEYAVQPTDDGEKVFADLQNGQELQSFIANVVVDASQKNSVQSQKAQDVKTIDDANAQTAVANLNASVVAATAAANAATEASSNLAAIAAEQQKVKAQMDYKRKEFNKLWNSASEEARNSLEANQKQWVEDRDSTCISEAQQADPERQEITRMQCITRLLGERYYEVKKYFDDY